MDDDSLTCQICLEKYDEKTPDKFPKKVVCCGQIFCYRCLEGIYTRNKNLLVCPLCRKTTNTNPSQLETVTSLFESFVSCPSCKGRITKNDLYINFETMSLKCIKCQQGDMPLETFLPDLVNDLSSFITGIQRNNMNLFKLMELKIKQNLDDFFIKIKEELACQLRDIVYSEIKSKLKYDIVNDVNSYNANLDKLSKSYTVMNNFLYKTENFNVNQLKEEIQYYSQNMEKIRDESTKFNSVFKFIDTPSTLFTLRNDIKEKEVQTFLVNIFETVLSDHKSDSLYTGINLFDTHIKETITKMEKVLIDKEQLLAQIRNFEKSMKINTNEIEPEKKEDNTYQDANFAQSENKNALAYDINSLYPAGTLNGKNFSLFD